MTENNVIVKSKVKELAENFNVGSDFVDALNEKAIQLIKDAMRRAEGNSRKTIMAKDL